MDAEDHMKIVTRCITLLNKEVGEDHFTHTHTRARKHKERTTIQQPLLHAKLRAHAARTHIIVNVHAEIQFTHVDTHARKHAPKVCQDGCRPLRSKLCAPSPPSLTQVEDLNSEYHAHLTADPSDTLRIALLSLRLPLPCPIFNDSLV
jgi:hypothetical protein